MKNMHFLLGATLLLGIAILLAGCSQPVPLNELPPTQNDDGSGSRTHMSDESNTEIAASLAKLPETDRALAEKQVNCPVSAEPLGSMGVPLKVTVKGRDVFLCCEGCKEALQENPDKYLADLPE